MLNDTALYGNQDYASLQSLQVTRFISLHKAMLEKLDARS